MAVTPAILLAKLQGLGIATDVFDHPAVLTVEEANKYTSDVPGIDVKNLFLKDKKNRLFLVAAATSTSPNIKALGLRLGVKSGLRFAPDELLESVLGVPPGSVTPLAVVQETASAVTLLVDQKLKGQDRILVHPLINTSTVAMSSDGLEKFLTSMDRQAHYVDLEAQPEAGPNQADLRYLVQDTEAAASAPMATSSAQSAAPQSSFSVQTSPDLYPTASASTSGTSVKEARSKSSKKGNKATSPTAPTPPAPSIQHTSARLLQQILNEAGADSLSPETTKQMTDTLFMELNALQNKCYSNGYMAGKQEVAKYCLSTFGS